MHHLKRNDINGYVLGQHTMYQLAARTIAPRIVSANAMQTFQLYNGFVDFWLSWHV